MTKTFNLLSTPIESGITLIEASAGTGKTYTITGLVLRLLLEEHIPSIDRVLVVTFTTAATEELKGRVRDALREALQVFDNEHPDAPDHLVELRKIHGDLGRKRIREALLDFDLIGILTIHGFCNRVLQQSAFESGMPFSFDFVQNDNELRRRAGEDFWRRHVYPAPVIVADLLSAKKWHPTSLQNEFKLFWRYQGTQILPNPAPLAQAAAHLENAVSDLRQHADRGQLDKEIERYVLNKRSLPSIRKHIHAALDYLEHGHSIGLKSFEEINYERLEKARTKQSPEIDHPFFDACETFQRQIESFTLAFRSAYFHHCAQNLGDLKREQNLLAFDDLLHRLHQAVRDPEKGPALCSSLQQQYQAVLIDEFQDTDQLQYRIFSEAFREGILYLIGDPKQAIYSFRGADIFAYLEARHDAAREYTLDTNWRSHSRLIDAVNATFGSSARPFAFAEIPFHKVLAAGRADSRGLRGDDQAPLQWRFLAPTEDAKGKSKPYNKDHGMEILLRDLSAECVRLLSKGITLGDSPLQPGDIAVLVKTNRQAQAVEDALRKVAIPTIISQAGDIFESREMEELRRILHAIHNPRRAAWVRAALSTEILGHTAVTVSDQDEGLWQAHIDDLETARSDWLQKGFVVMAHALIARHGIRERLLAFADGERRLTNLLHAIELLHQESLSRRLSPDGLLHWIEGQFERDGKVDETRELRLDSDRHAIQIVTMHKSKGLEYEIVFCLGLGMTRVPNKGDPALAHLPVDKSVILDYGTAKFSEHQSIHDAERLAEELRLAYVALTRARQRCYVLWGDIGTKKPATERSELTFLLHQLEDQPAADDTTAGWAETVFKSAKAHELWATVFAERIQSLGDCAAFHLIDPSIRSSAWTNPDRATTDYTARKFPDRPHQMLPWRVTSFSALTSDREAEHRDHADPAAEGAAPTIGEGIFAFARGARAGTCLHEIFEHCEFAGPAEALSTLIETTLTRYGLEAPAAHRGVTDPIRDVQKMVRAVLDSTIPELDLRLSDIPPTSRFDEWPFFMAFDSIVPAELARVFTDHATDRIAREYAPALATLNPMTIEGYLTGFVDLICERNGRWFIFDWKSNHLGNQREEYHQDKMWTAMVSHHYVLQYHIYCLALHRYLQTRLGSSYDYEQHFGGAGYAFLRGIDTDPQLGWYVDRPPAALIEALDTFFRCQTRGVFA